MTKFFTVLATSGALALAAAATPTTADARCFGCAVGAGVVAGVAAGAIIAGAASDRGYYSPGYAYDPGYAYGPGYGYGPGYAYDGPAYPAYGYDYGYRRRGYSTADETNSDRMMQGTR